MQIIQIPCRQDNYAIIVHDDETNTTVLFDAPEHDPIENLLTQNEWQLDAILLTHFHYDHIEAAASLKNLYNCNIYASSVGSENIDYINHYIEAQNQINFGNINIQIMQTPGHTPEQIVFYIESLKSAIVADTIFSLGCARILNGTPAQLFSSIQQICQLPDNTQLYCGHEYTQANGMFALNVDAKNHALKSRMAEVKMLRAQNKPTLPTSLAQEKRTNPFLRCNDAAIKQHLDMVDATELEIFTKLRSLKDVF